MSAAGQASDELKGLPDDVREEMAAHMPDPVAQLDAISTAIAARRDEAKAARSSSGIEQIWRYAEEAYLGIDDANRSEFQSARWAKPSAIDGPVTTDRKPVTPNFKSTVFVPMTARYVDAASAKVSEILLPADDKAFSFTETPVPDLIKAKEDKSQVIHDGMGNMPLMRPLKPGETPPPPTTGPAPAQVQPSALNPMLQGMVPQQPGAAPAGPQDLRAGLPGQAPAGPPMVPLTVADLAEEAIEMARKKAKAAEKRIYDWLVECQYPAEMRKVIFDSSRLGVGVVKGPFPKSKRNIAVLKGTSNLVQVKIQDKISPAASWVDPWNCFPDPACGENIHDGDFFFERDHMAPRQVRDLKKLPGYIASQIDKVLELGPPKDGTNDGEGNGGNTKDAAQVKGRFEVWYYYGTLTRAEMDCVCAAANKPLSKEEVPEDQDQVFVIVTMIGDTAVRATINPLDSGRFPYRSIPWRRRTGNWAGIGVPEQLRTAQKMINGATRAMNDNAGKSAGCIMVVDRASISPADGNWILTPDKIFNKNPDSPGQDVRQAVTVFQIPNVTPQLMSIIEYALRLAEESTSIPLVTQGQSGPTTPDTFGAAQLQNNNANQLLRSIGYTFDDNNTEPLIRDFYEWLLLDPDVPDDEKGDFNINAHGSAALVERAIQDQTIAQMGPLVKDPAYGWDPKKWADLFAKSKRLDPGDLKYTPEQQAKLDAAPPPVAPAVQAAQVRAATDKEIARGDQALQAKNIQVDHDTAAAGLTVDLHELSLQERLTMLEYANKRDMTLDQVKAELAQTSMKLNTQEKLNAVDTAADLHKHHNPGPTMNPPVQVPGKAGNGKAFSQAN